MWVLGLLIVLVPVGLIYGLMTAPPEMWWFLLWFILVGLAAAYFGISVQEGGRLHVWYMSRPMTERQAKRRIRREFRRGNRDITNILRAPGRIRRAKRLHPWVAGSAIISGAVSTYMFFFELDLRVWAISVVVAVVNLILLALVRRHIPSKEDSTE